MSLHTVLHVERAFSAQPTLGDLLGRDVEVRELPLAEALAGNTTPDIVWSSDTTADVVRILRLRFPRSQLLATVPPRCDPATVVLLFAHGADLVLRDEGVLLAAAAMGSMLRRTEPKADSRTATPI